MRTISLIVVFLLLGAFFIISQNNLHMGSGSEVKEFKVFYFSWLSNLFDNTKVITGNVVNLRWLPSSDNASGN